MDSAYGESAVNRPAGSASAAAACYWKQLPHRIGHVLSVQRWNSGKQLFNRNRYVLSLQRRHPGKQLPDRRRNVFPIPIIGTLRNADSPRARGTPAGVAFCGRIPCIPSDFCLFESPSSGSFPHLFAARKHLVDDLLPFPQFPHRAERPRPQEHRQNQRYRNVDRRWQLSHQHAGGVADRSTQCAVGERSAAGCFIIGSMSASTNPSRFAELLRAAGAAVHALRSYQYGNISPALTKEVADKLEAALSPALEENDHLLKELLVSTNHFLKGIEDLRAAVTKNVSAAPDASAQP